MSETEDNDQPVPTCDDCEKPLEYHCETCGDKLCSEHRDQHLQNRRTRNHNTKPYNPGSRIQTKQTNTCAIHPGESFVVYCKPPCQIPVCRSCISDTHSTHAFISIPEAYTMAKDMAKPKLEYLQKKIRPELKQAFEGAQRTRMALEKRISSVDTEMKMSAQLLEKTTDQVLNQSLKQLRQIKEETVMPLARKQEDNLTSLNGRLEMKIKEYEDSLQSENPINLILLMNEWGTENLEELFKFPNIEQIPMPTFHPAPLSIEVIRDQFGTLKLEKEEDDVLASSSSPSTEALQIQSESLPQQKEEGEEFSSSSSDSTNGDSTRQTAELTSSLHIQSQGLDERDDKDGYILAKEHPDQ